MYQMHFFEHDLQENGMLEKQEEEIITEMTYLMEEYYYPEDDIVLNKGDELDGILFVIEGEIHMVLKSGSQQEYLLDRLYKRCTYGYHSCLKILRAEDGKYPVVAHKLISQAETTVLKLPFEIIKNMRKKSKVLSKVIEKQKKIDPQCDFTTFLTYNKKLTRRQLRTKFKRAVRRQIQISRDKNYRNKLLNFALQKELGNDGGEIVNMEFFEEDAHIHAMDLSQRAQRSIESKLFSLLTNSEILEDIEIISAQSQIQKKKVQNILDYIRGQLEDF